MNFSVALVLPVSEPVPAGFEQAGFSDGVYSALKTNLSRFEFNEITKRYKLHATKDLSAYEDSARHIVSGLYFESQNEKVCAVVDCKPKLRASWHAQNSGRSSRAVSRMYAALSNVYRDKRFLN